MSRILLIDARSVSNDEYSPSGIAVRRATLLEWAVMMLRDKVQETISRARDLKYQTEDVLLTSLHTELAAIQTFCVLARQETGHKRTHHLQEVEKAFHAILDIAKRVRLSQQDDDAIEQAHRDMLSLAVMTPIKT